MAFVVCLQNGTVARTSSCRLAEVIPAKPEDNIRLYYRLVSTSRNIRQRDTTSGACLPVPGLIVDYSSEQNEFYSGLVVALLSSVGGCCPTMPEDSVCIIPSVGGSCPTMSEDSVLAIPSVGGIHPTIPEGSARAIPSVGGIHPTIPEDSALGIPSVGGFYPTMPEVLADRNEAYPEVTATFGLAGFAFADWRVWF